jgi:hypothetical protein
LTGALPIGINIDTKRYHPALAESNVARGHPKPELKGTSAMAHPNALIIDDLLADPLIQKVMRADHVEPQVLRSLLTGTARRIADSRRAISVQVGQDLGRRGSLRGPLLLMRPMTRAAGGECGASLCG